MKTSRFSFEKAVQEVTENSTQWLTDEFKEILEADKEFTRKADYIGYSITSIDNKIASLDEEIAQMQDMKKKLKVAKEIALTVGAEVFEQYGVEKLEGAGISSITVTPAVSSSTTKLTATDEAMLIRAGFSKVVLDMDMVHKRYSAKEYTDIIEAYTVSETIDKSVSPSDAVNTVSNPSTNSASNSVLVGVPSPSRV